jgi:threonylcarbamoyladenosine tRNA methylthiotransferase MtaB
MAKMQAENNKNDIKTVSFGCRLNALECEKIKHMLSPHGISAVVVNTCSVTAEAERQCGQTIRKIARENPGAIIFVTGCGASRNPELFKKIPGAIVIPNSEKMNLNAYLPYIAKNNRGNSYSLNIKNSDEETKLSKQFIQIQNGCNHDCTYCITRILRGPAVSFEYDAILTDVRRAVANGFGEIVLTGVDAASYVKIYDGHPFLISDLCKRLLNDVPEIRRLRLSSVDPAVPAIRDIIKMMKTNNRFMPHLHLSMQSGSDTILESMRRRHTADTVRELVQLSDNRISFSWDIICGFPGETDELFNETLDLVRELKPIKIHAFPYSARPGTVAAEMPNQVDRAIAKERVRIITDIANENMTRFMTTKIGETTSVLVESDNMARTPDDIPVRIIGNTIPARTICDVKITGIDGEFLVGHVSG